MTIIVSRKMPKNMGLTGLFEVYSIAGGEALCKPMEYDAAIKEFESITVGAGGVCNGMDIRRAAA